MMPISKKVLLVVFFCLAAAICAEPLDFVVLLDVSESMLPYFDDTVNYLIGDILQQHLKQDDGFHLLTFADSPGIELMLDIESAADVDEALSRVLLLHPLGKYTDLVSALKYVYSYTSSIRQDSRKKILVLTDGIHDPPPGSPYPVNGGIYRETASEVARQIRKKGWEISLIQFPSPVVKLETDKEDRMTGNFGDAEQRGEVTADEVPAEKPEADNDLYPALAEDLDVEVVPYNQQGKDTNHRVIGAPELVFPDDLGRVGRAFILPFTVRNLSTEKILVEMTEIVWGGIDLLVNPVKTTVEPEESAKLRARVRLPDSTKPGPLELDLSVGFSDELRIYPRQGSVSIVLRERGLGEGGKSGRLLTILGYVGIALGGIIGLALVVFAVRSLVDRVSSAINAASMKRGPEAIDDRSIEMYVEGQNPHIGGRNIHHIRKNGSATVGGGLSTFLIYLYKLPPKVGIISRKEDSYSFTPTKHEYFESPDTIEDCINKNITILCGHGRKLRICFRRYISALEEINMLMRSIYKPKPEEKEI
jgi:hypothetical protein